MKRTAIALILAALATSGAYALGLGRQGVGMGKLGASSQAGPAAITPTCTPGGPTGQMDFSVCSNIAITAAVL